MDSASADLLRTIGLNIKAERVRRELTQHDLAELTGLEPAQIARMERGEMDTGVTKYIRVGRALGVTPEALLQGLSDLT